MRFRGGGVGHSSTRAATDTFKNDRDNLDITSQRAQRNSEPPTHSNMEEDDDELEDEMPVIDEERDVEGDIDEDGQLSDSEVVDYGYEVESELDEEEEDREAGEEDDTTGELGTLGYAEY